MTNGDLEAIFKANLGLSLQTALHAVFTQGYCAGAGLTPNAAGTIDRVATTTKPTVTVKLSHIGA